MTFTGHTPGSPAYRRLIVGLFFAGIATFAQLYSPQAVLPQLSSNLGITPATAALAVSAATLGLAAAVVPWSMVADRMGRVPAMGISASSQRRRWGFSRPSAPAWRCCWHCGCSRAWRWAPCPRWRSHISARR
ncbi:MFS transporter [Microbacterium forte]|uniref:MFS transporter n=1 Tax=Microbacterium forte TaxID=2982533 RepID=UPI002892F0A3|nr:MFS transporter [Microbacterium sp. A(2022)]